MAVPLSLANLDAISAKAGVPGYARSDLSRGILHFGVGNFHRAHQAVYLDRLFAKGLGQDWALVGAGVMQGDKRARDVLAAQDWLTTVVEQEADYSRAHVTGAMIDYVEPGNGTAILEALADPAIRIVSLTITEGGYFLDADDNFDPEHPAMAADAANPQDPKTVFGLIIAGLRRRQEQGTPPFTVMCCDNIPHNGKVTRNTLCGLAELSDPQMAQWIRDNVSFPNAMVDRITPATSDRERKICSEEYGIEDGWPVFCEGFKQWVLEDDFPQGRPPLEEAGVQFVADVTPFELMKLRILNAGHAVIAYPAGLMDVHFVHEAMEHPLVSAFLDKVEKDEIIPSVPPVPDTDTGEYYKLIVRRFSNPKIGDTVRRLCLDGSNRQPKFVIPVITDNLLAGRPVNGLALESALWCRYCSGKTDSGQVIAPNDPNWGRLQERAAAAKSSPGEWLAMKEVYGEAAANPEFVSRFSHWLNMLWQKGTHATLEAYLEGL
jgi:mannitol 2-dehydrogenase